MFASDTFHWVDLEVGRVYLLSLSTSENAMVNPA
jgi:hypothetical protein